MPRQKITTPEIIGIAINVFRNNGYHGTSMAKLAQACGLMKGSFYNHFSSKEDILLVTIKSLNDYLNERVFKIAYDKTLKPRERMKKILDKLSNVLRSDQGGCLVGNMTLELYNGHQEFKECLEKYFGDWLNAFTTIFEEKYKNKRAVKLAQISIQEFEGAIMMGRIFKNDELLRDTIDGITSRL